jgi:hypothetical protein
LLRIYSVQIWEHKMGKGWEKQEGHHNETSFWKAHQVQQLKLPTMNYSNQV